MIKNSIYIILFFLIVGCSPEKKATEAPDATTMNQPINTAEKVIDTVGQKHNNEGCVFNDDYKGLTTEWLKELKKSNFIWRPDLNRAVLPMGQDTVFLSKGGCEHFGISVELKLTYSDHPLTDSVYWVSKALGLSNEYQMNYYSQKIKEGKIKRAQTGSTNSVWYQVDDDNTEDNLFYTGIEISFDGKAKWISISQYFN